MTKVMGLSVDSHSGRHSIGRGKLPVRVQRPRLQGELTVRPSRPGLLPSPDVLQADVLRGVVVSVKRIAALRTGKVRLRRSVVSSRVAALRTPLRGVRRVHLYGVNTERFGLVRDELEKTVKRPRMELLGFRHPRTDTVQSLENDSRTAVFDRFGDKFLRDVMQQVFRPSALAVADRLNRSVSRLGASLLKAATNALVGFASVIEQAAGPESPGRSDRQILDTEVHAEDRRVLDGFGFVHLRLCAEVEVERTVAVVECRTSNVEIVVFDVLAERRSVRFRWQNVLGFDPAIHRRKRSVVFMKRRASLVVFGEVGSERREFGILTVGPPRDDTFEGVRRPRTSSLHEVRGESVGSLADFAVGAFVEALFARLNVTVIVASALNDEVRGEAKLGERRKQGFGGTVAHVKLDWNSAPNLHTSY